MYDSLRSRYKLEDLKELQAFASQRAVTIIGEMDVPGHSSGLVTALPEIFAFPSSPHVQYSGESLKPKAFERTFKRVKQKRLC